MIQDTESGVEEAQSFKMKGCPGTGSFTAALFLAAAIAVLLNSPPTDAVGISATTFKTASKNVASQYFGQSMTSPYVVLAYLTQTELANPNLDLVTLCQNPHKGLLTNFPANTTLHPTYDEIWAMIYNTNYYRPVNYTASNAKTYSAAWSTKCFSARFYLKQPGTFAPHYEQLLAVWMLNGLRDLNTGEVLAVLGSRKPCDYGEQADHTMRYCSDILRDVFHMRNNKVKKDLAKNTLYINALDTTFFLVFDWHTESVITLGWTNPTQYIDEVMDDYVIDPIRTVNGNPGPQTNCVFPFIYRNEYFFSCTIMDHTTFWCATTDDFDDDGYWGECPASRTKGKQEAVSTSGVSANCMFPFTVDGGKTNYYDCAYYDYGTKEPWCLTSTSGNWGNCKAQNTINGTEINDPTIVKRCAIPFTYKNKKYSSCTMVDRTDNEYWCSRDVVDEGVHYLCF